MVSSTDEEHDAVLFARLDGPPRGLVVPELANLVGSAENDDVAALVVGRDFGIAPWRP